MGKYDKKVRPAAGFNESVRVAFKLYLNQLLDVVSTTTVKLCNVTLDCHGVLICLVHSMGPWAAKNRGDFKAKKLRKR